MADNGDAGRVFDPASLAAAMSDPTTLRAFETLLTNLATVTSNPGTGVPFGSAPATTAAGPSSSTAIPSPSTMLAPGAESFTGLQPPVPPTHPDPPPLAPHGPPSIHPTRPPAPAPSTSAPSSRTPTNVGVLNTSSTVQAPVADPKRAEAFTRRMLHRAMERGGMEALEQEVRRVDEVEKDVMNHHTKLKRDSVLFTWAAIVGRGENPIHPDLLWTTEVVQQHACPYLTMRLLTSQGKWGKYVTAATLLSWLTSLTWMIAKFCHDPITKNKTGPETLAGGLYVAMEVQVLFLIREYKLARHSKERVYLGLEEVKLLIDQALIDSIDRGRQVALMRICCMLLAAYTGFRPSTFTADTKLAHKEGNYLKARHFRFLRTGPGVYNIIVTAENFKRHLVTATGERLEHVLHAVTKVANTAVGNWWFMAYFFSLGLFECETLEDLFNNTDAELRIKPEKLDTPFVLAATYGGDWLILDPPEGPKAAMTGALNGAIVNTGYNAGFSTVNFKGLRSAAANAVARDLGSRIARMLLLHKGGEDRVLNAHYTKATANLNIVALLNHEILPQNAGPMRDSVLFHHSLLSLATKVVTARGGSLDATYTGRQKRRLGQWDNPDVANDLEMLQQTEHHEMLITAVDSAIQTWEEHWQHILPLIDPDILAGISRNAKPLDKEGNVTVTKKPNLPRAWVKVEGQLESLRDNEILYEFDEEDEARWTADKLAINTAYEALLAGNKQIRKKANLNHRKRPPTPPAIDSTDARVAAATKLKTGVQGFVQTAAQGAQATLNTSSSTPQMQPGPSAVLSRPALTIQPSPLPPASGPTSTSSSALPPSSSTRGTTLATASLDVDGHQVRAGDFIDLDQVAHYAAREADPYELFVDEDDDQLQTLSSSVQSMIRGTREKVNQVDLPPEPPDPIGPIPLGDLKLHTDGRVTSRNFFDDTNEPEFFKGLTVADVQKQLMIDVLQPHFEQLARRAEMARVKEQSGKPGFHCPRCAEFHNFPAMAEKVWESQWKLSRHLAQFHSAWDDLEYTSANPERTRWTCPKCDGRFRSAKTMYLHFGSDCPDREYFVGLLTGAKSQTPDTIDDDEDDGLPSEPATDEEEEFLSRSSKPPRRDVREEAARLELTASDVISASGLEQELDEAQASELHQILESHLRLLSRK